MKEEDLADSETDAGPCVRKGNVKLLIDESHRGYIESNRTWQPFRERRRGRDDNKQWGGKD